MSLSAPQIEEISRSVRDALIEEYGDSQDRCRRGYVPTQSIREVMDYLDSDQIQAVRAERRVKDHSESFKMPGRDLPPYVQTEEQIKRELVLDYDRADYSSFEWDRISEFLFESELEDIAVRKLVVRMDNENLREHLFTLLQKAIDYPTSYKSEFTEPFYFVMESRSPKRAREYRMVEDQHDEGYLQELGWAPRCLDLLAIWSHEAWTKSGASPFADSDGKVTQRDVEEYAFNQRSGDEPIFGAVNSSLVINRWREPFGRGMTDMRPYEWSENGEWEVVENGSVE